MTNRQAAAVRRVTDGAGKFIDAMSELDAAFRSSVEGPLLRRRAHLLLLNLRLDLDLALEITNSAVLRRQVTEDPLRPGSWWYLRADGMVDVRMLLPRERAVPLLDRSRVA